MVALTLKDSIGSQTLVAGSTATVGRADTDGIKEEIPLRAATNKIARKSEVRMALRAQFFLDKLINSSPTSHLK
jgi:hypothetical protein